MSTRLNGIATPFGALDMRLQVDRSGETATLEVKPLAANCKAVVVHQPDGNIGRMDPQRGGRLKFKIQSR
jgi:hypothetical protein